MSLLQGHFPYTPVPPPRLYQIPFFSTLLLWYLSKSGHLVITCLDSGIVNTKDRSWGFQETPHGDSQCLRCSRRQRPSMKRSLSWWECWALIAGMPEVRTPLAFEGVQTNIPPNKQTKKHTLFPLIQQEPAFGHLQPRLSFPNFVECCSYHLLPWQPTLNESVSWIIEVERQLMVWVLHKFYLH